ncbi:MAG TPA: MarR family winged helix-turn-helix transcriptional regulator [Vicinamibacterales bacterium]|jgi:DNA-binding MarR family transcriptional regulator|nr:MarR family winged helix-turn-helix transcriptional regulator [Vicinamibacterales bacterium]
MARPPSSSTIAGSATALRRFTRFYTKLTGLLEPAYLQTRYSVTQARLLYELGRNDRLTATELVATLGLNAGYISRVLTAFERDGLLHRERAPLDGRRRTLRLTTAGRREVAVIDRRSQRQAKRALRRLSSDDRRRVVEAIDTIERVLSPASR